MKHVNIIYKNYLLNYINMFYTFCVSSYLIFFIFVIYIYMTKVIVFKNVSFNRNTYFFVYKFLTLNVFIFLIFN